MRLLVVEEDKESRTFLQRGLSKEGFSVDVAESGRAALDLAADVSFDALLLNAHLTDLSGLALVGILRKERYPAVIILFSLQEEEPDKLESLYAGADDFLIKPTLREMAVKLHIHLQRPRAWEVNALNPAELVLGDLRMNLLTRRVECAGKEIRLTPKESDLLECLMRHPGHILSVEILLQEVWNIEYDGDSNVVERHICRLRVKLNVHSSSHHHHIETLRKRGYRLAA